MKENAEEERVKNNSLNTHRLLFSDINAVGSYKRIPSVTLFFNKAQLKIIY